MSEWSGDPNHFGVAGHFDAHQHAISVEGNTFAVDRSSDYRVVARSQLVISIPGTKCMEAAVLGRPLLVAVPLNRVDEVAMNGIWAYVHRVPIIGRPVKRWIAKQVVRRIAFFAQPNIDAGRMVAPEMRGILRPQDVAARAAAMLDNPHELRLMGEHLSALYAPHVGAASRMVGDVLAFVERARTQQVAV